MDYNVIQTITLHRQLLPLKVVHYVIRTIYIIKIMDIKKNRLTVLSKPLGLPNVAVNVILTIMLSTQ